MMNMFRLDLFVDKMCVGFWEKRSTQRYVPSPSNCLFKLSSAAGAKVTAWLTDSFGVLRIRRSQRGTKISHPKAICHIAQAHGNG